MIRIRVRARFRISYVFSPRMILEIYTKVMIKYQELAGELFQNPTVISTYPTRIRT